MKQLLVAIALLAATSAFAEEPKFVHQLIIRIGTSAITGPLYRESDVCKAARKAVQATMTKERLGTAHCLPVLQQGPQP